MFSGNIRENEVDVRLNHKFEPLLSRNFECSKNSKRYSIKTSLLALNSTIEVARAQKSLANPCKLKI